jgi:hypothetical protein
LKKTINKQHKHGPLTIEYKNNLVTLTRTSPKKNLTESVKLTIDELGNFVDREKTIIGKLGNGHYICVQINNDLSIIRKDKTKERIVIYNEELLDLKNFWKKIKQKPPK